VIQCLQLQHGLHVIFEDVKALHDDKASFPPHRIAVLQAYLREPTHRLVSMHIFKTRYLRDQYEYFRGVITTIENH
jgi:hypothetical protein